MNTTVLLQMMMLHNGYAGSVVSQTEGRVEESAYEEAAETTVAELKVNAVRGLLIISLLIMNKRNEF